MAEYRFSAQSISRGKGQSSVASAAYRSASRLVDERTGEIHDYTRKAGVIHSEVLTPDGTPEWMQDRDQLWNAVEAVEKRKNSQLAREIQLSLPHELDHEQRKKLVLDFVQENFVDHGMIADIAIHTPSQAGDERNHHAHVMLTMRELTAEGFHSQKATPTARSWNSEDQLKEWRKEWAHHQNNALERHGHDVRVDHRSFEDQGVDREPSQHLGPIASDMERNGKKSRIGDENREIANDNSNRVADHIEMVNLTAEIKREKLKFKGWEHYKNTEFMNAQELANLDLSQKHHRQKLGLDAELEERHGTAKRTISVELSVIDRKLQAKGVRKVLRAVFGRTGNDKAAKNNLEKTLSGIETREQEEHQELARRQSIELSKEARRQSKNKDRLKKGVEKAKERREATDWKPRASTRGTKRTGRPQKVKTAKAAPSVARTKQNAPTATTASNIKPSKAHKEPEFKKSDAPTLADLKMKSVSSLDKLREGNKLNTLWRDSQKSELNQIREGKSKVILRTPTNDKK